MLLIKCPQCQASYRLAESLYRRKAAGYGVVITCRRCKTQIHLDEGALPPTAGDSDQAAPETPEGDVAASPAPALATPAAPTPLAPKVEDPITDPVGLPPPDPRNPADDTTDAALNALPNVAPKPAAPRPTGVPRPGGGPSPARRGGTLLGIPPPANPPSALVPANEAASRDAASDAWKPKLVALSPGLLGVQTATRVAPRAEAATAPKAAPHGAPPGAKPPPGPPHPTHHAQPVEEESPDSIEPISAGSVVLLDSTQDSEPIEPPPDSAMPISSVDYLSSPEPDLPAPPPPPKADAQAAEAKAAPQGKRLPTPPPTPHLPKVSPRVADDEAPSQTSAPKISELALESSPLPLSQKKGESKRRKRQQSGDLTDDFLSNDMSFEPAPALAPPDAGALARAPISSRPAPAASTSTKAPVAKTAGVERKSSGGRGIAILLVMAAFGGAGYVLQHRAVTPEPPVPEPQAAVNVAPPEPATPPSDNAAPPADTASAAPAESSSAAPETSASPAPQAPATGLAAPATAPGAATTAPTVTPKTPKPVAEGPAAPSEKPEGPATAKPAGATTAAALTTTAPASTAVVEPRGAAGTEPFDVAAARGALDASAAQASGCRKEGDPSGVAVVTITFSQTGRVTTANISGPPFQATPTGGCIASTMRKTRVPAFAGEMVTVRKTITVQ
jgi:hypothetical protein